MPVNTIWYDIIRFLAMRQIRWQNNSALSPMILKTHPRIRFYIHENALPQDLIKSRKREIGWLINTLRPGQNGHHFADDIFKYIFLNENVWISLKISLKFVPKGPINNIPALVKIMAWRRPGDKPLSEPMMVSLPTHICVTRPQWLPTLLIHIRSQVKTKHSQSYKFKKIAKYSNLWFCWIFTCDILWKWWCNYFNTSLVTSKFSDI